MTSRTVTATRIIAAPAEKIFDVLADPSQHPAIDGSGSLTKPRSNLGRLSLGAKFSMDMKLVVPYVTKNVVSEFEENRLIAWHHFAKFIWRYELEAVDGGTKVTETFDYSKPWGVILTPLGIPEKNRVGMEKTLERLEHLVTTGAA